MSIPLEDIMSGQFTINAFNATWASDFELLYNDAGGAIILLDVLQKKKKILLRNTLLAHHLTIQLEISADRRYVLLSGNYSKLFRHSFLAHYDIFDIEQNKKIPLINSEDLPDSRIIQLVTWAPTGNAFIYVYHNNIYYRPDAESCKEYKLTTTGVFGTIYHGMPDWVYEEEVFASNKAVWFSPNGKKLAYATFNDSSVQWYSIPYYGFPTDMEFQYNREIKIRYPKPGTSNPEVSLTVVNLECGFDYFDIPPPKLFANCQPILTAVAWANENEVAAIWMNRLQNQAIVVICNTLNVTCVNVFTMNEPSGWVDLFVPPVFSETGDKMLLILPHEQDESSGAYKHLTLIDRSSLGPRMVVLTSGKFVVTEILAWDEKMRVIYFLATEAGDPANQHLYSISSDASCNSKPRCLSCNIRTRDGGELCLYNKAQFSKGYSFYILHCGGPDIPETSVYSKENRLLFVWEANGELREMLKTRSLPTIHRMQVEVAGGYMAQVQLWLPPKIHTFYQYPLLVNVYGGPDSFQVTKRFNIDWGTYMTVNKSIVYATIDGRGSGLKGDSMLFAGYRRLGSVEIEDQIAVTRYIQNHFDFIDKKRTGIWGWSYGGYSAGMVLATDIKNVFKCGISVAPVTDWSYYDTVYTERYMGMPTADDNREGYVASQLTNKVENFRNKMFYLIHGSMDDNVHYQHSMMLAKELEHRDILFRQQSYTDEEHGLSAVRPHLYHSLEKFVVDCFNLA